MAIIAPIPQQTRADSGAPKPALLIVAFSGWTDAGGAASGVVRHLLNLWRPEVVAEIASDAYYDFTSQRPWIVTEPDNPRPKIVWPHLTFYRHSDDQQDVIMALGSEPNNRWQAFTRELIAISRKLNVGHVVVLGSMLAAISHRDTVPLKGWASPDSLARVVYAEGVAPGIDYHGPTGVGTILADALANEGFPVASLFVSVPTYISSSLNPKAVLTFLKVISRVFDVPLPQGDLADVSERFELTVDKLVSEAQTNSQTAPPASSVTPEPPTGNQDALPDASEIIRDLDEFFRKGPSADNELS